MKQKRMSGCSKGGHTSKSQEMTNSPKRNEMIKESESSINDSSINSQGSGKPSRILGSVLADKDEHSGSAGTELGGVSEGAEATAEP